MSESGLFQKINYDKAYRKNRLGAAEWVLAHPETFPELLKYCFHEDKELAKKATWVLDFVCRDSLELLFHHLDFFFKNLPKAQGDGALRSVSFVCELLTIQYYKKKAPEITKLLTAHHKEVMTECCFEWMITDQKVACEARAMLALYYLGTENDWIHPELSEIILRKIHHGSAGYQSRGKAVLQLISKHRKSRDES